MEPMISFTPTRMTKIKNTENTKNQGECGETGTFIYYWWECEIINRFGKPC